MNDASAQLAKLSPDQRAKALSDMVETMAQERAMEIAGKLMGMHSTFVKSRFSLSQHRRAVAHDTASVIVPEFSPQQIRSLRTAVSNSTKDFQSKFGIPARTVDGWEQGKRKPDPSSRALLRLIEIDPARVSTMLLQRATIPASN